MIMYWCCEWTNWLWWILPKKPKTKKPKQTPISHWPSIQLPTSMLSRFTKASFRNLANALDFLIRWCHDSTKYPFSRFCIRLMFPYDILNFARTRGSHYANYYNTHTPFGNEIHPLQYHSYSTDTHVPPAADLLFVHYTQTYLSQPAMEQNLF